MDRARLGRWPVPALLDAEVDEDAADAAAAQDAAASAALDDPAAAPASKDAATACAIIWRRFAAISSSSSLHSSTNVEPILVLL